VWDRADELCDSAVKYVRIECWRGRADGAVAAAEADVFGGGRPLEVDLRLGLADIAPNCISGSW
jgi:hypothetical protein